MRKSARDVSVGYSAKTFVCDFEAVERCGWMSSSPDSNYVWQARQRGAGPLTSGPSSDYTTGTASGWNAPTT